MSWSDSVRIYDASTPLNAKLVQQRDPSFEGLLAKVATRWAGVEDDLTLTNLVTPLSAIVSMSAALPLITILSLPFDLAGTMLPGPADLVGDVNQVKNILL